MVTRSPSRTTHLIFKIYWLSESYISCKSSCIASSTLPGLLGASLQDRVGASKPFPPLRLSSTSSSSHALLTPSSAAQPDQRRRPRVHGKIHDVLTDIGRAIVPVHGIPVQPKSNVYDQSRTAGGSPLLLQVTKDRSIHCMVHKALIQHRGTI